MAEYKTFIPAAWAEFAAKCKALFPFLKKTFIGTRAEWDALTLEEKQNYDKADITDDLAGGEMLIVDEVTEGNLNPVTSNAVADAIKSGLPKTKIYTYTDAVTAGVNIILDPSSSHDWWNLLSNGNILSISLVSCDTANAVDVGAWAGTTTANHGLILRPATTASNSYYRVLVTYTGVNL